MSNTILPKLIQLGVNALVKSGGDPIRTVQNTVNQVRQAVDTFATNVVHRAQEGRLFSQFGWGPMGEPFAAQLRGANVGAEGQRTDPVGANNSVPHGVEIAQQFLGRLGYLDVAHQLPGTFNDATGLAVQQFQRDNGLPVTGVVDDATVDAMLNPRPRPGYGMPTTEGRFDPNGTIALSQSLFQEAANVYGPQLGLATSAARTQADGSTTQQFENGSLLRTADGGIQLLDREGNNLLPQSDYSAVQAEAGGHFINQLAADASNQNCGYASTNMVLSYLGVPGWGLEGMTAQQSYESTMSLRAVGQPGTVDGASTTTTGIATALTTQEMQDAGVQTSYWENTSNGSRQADADRMALTFMSGENANTAFVVGGNPALGWGDTEGMDAQYAGGVFNGSHFVAVVGFNPETDSFLVMDPMANGPIEVSRQDMVEYMEDQLGVTQGEVRQITYNPPPEQAQQP